MRNPFRSKGRSELERLTAQALKLRSANQWDSAIDMQTKVASLATQELSEADPACALAFRRLGMMYVTAGRMTESANPLRSALALARHYPPADPQVLILDLHNLGAVCRQIGELDEAEPLLLEALQLERSHAETNATVLVMTAQELGELYVARADYAAAIGPCQETLALRERELGQAHEYTVKNRQYLAWLREQLVVSAAAKQTAGEYAEAAATYRMVLESESRSSEWVDDQLAAAANNLAEIYRNQGQYAEAEPLFRDAVHMLRTLYGSDHSQIGMTLGNWALARQAQGDYAGSEQMLLEALGIWRRTLGNDNPDVANGLERLADVYEKKGDFANVVRAVEQALAIRRAHPESTDRLTATASRLAAVFASSERFGDAISLLEDLLPVVSAAQTDASAEYATSLNDLGLAYLLAHDHERASETLTRALAIRRVVLGDNDLRVANTLRSLGQVAAERFNIQAAQAFYVEALEISRSVPGDEGREDFAITLDRLGQLSYQQGLYMDALQRYEEEVQLLQHLPDNQPLGSALNNIALVHLAMGNFIRAESVVREALLGGSSSTRTPGDYDPGALNTLGLIYLEMGDTSRAISVFRRAVDLCVNEGATTLVATVQSNLASAVLDDRTGPPDFEEAERLFRAALATHQRVGGDRHPHSGTELHHLGDLFARKAWVTGSQQDRTTAAEFYDQALAIRRAVLGPIHREVAATLSQMAVLAAQSGEALKAETLYEEALDIARAALGSRHPEVATTMYGLALLYAWGGRIEACVNALREALDIKDGLAEQVFRMSSEEQRMEHAKSLYWSDLVIGLAVVSQHIDKSSELAIFGLNLALRRKAIVLEAAASLNRATLAEGDAALQELRRQLRDVRSRIGMAILEGPPANGMSALTSHLATLAELEQTREGIEAELARRVPRTVWDLNFRGATVDEVASALPTGSALVEFVEYLRGDIQIFAAGSSSELERLLEKGSQRSYCAFVIHAGQPPLVAFVDLGDADLIDKLIVEFRTQICQPIAQRDARTRQEKDPGITLADVGRQVRQMVFDPLLSALEGVTRLYLAPAGEMIRLSFAALPSDAGFLIDTYKLSYVNVGRDVLRFGGGNSDHAGTPIVAVDPDYNLGNASNGPRGAASESNRRGLVETVSNKGLRFGPLPGAKAEGIAIAAVLGVPLLSGPAVVDSTIKQCTSPRVLHLATHGIYMADQEGSVWFGVPRRFATAEWHDENNTVVVGAGLVNPLLRSGLAMAGVNTWLEGGSLPLGAEDGLLMADDVTGMDLRGTELVVLAACESGLGEDVAGEGSFGLRRAFAVAGARAVVSTLWSIADVATADLLADWYRRMQQGEGHADALRAAQLAIKQREEFADPFFWGAFIYEGDPTVTDNRST